jgi:hypothetical protein
VDLLRRARRFLGEGGAALTVTLTTALDWLWLVFLFLLPDIVWRLDNTMDLFYRRPELVTQDYDTDRVGVLNESPEATLDVGGDMVVRGDVEAPSNAVYALTIDARSNLMIGGHSLYDPCPSDTEWGTWQEFLPFNPDDQGFIHSSWLRRPKNTADILSDLWNVGEGIVDLAQGLYGAYELWQSLQGSTLEQAAIEAVKAILEDNGSSGSNPTTDIRPSWERLKDLPIAGRGTLGFGGDLYVSDAVSIYGLKDDKLVRSADGLNNLSFTTTNLAPHRRRMLDMGTHTAYLGQLVVGSNEAHSNVWISATDPDMRLQNWQLSETTITNRLSPLTQSQPLPVGLTWSQDSNMLVVSGGDLVCARRLQIQAPWNLNVNTIRPFSSNYSHDITFGSNTSRIRHAGSNGATTVTLYNDTVELTTQAPESVAPTGVKPVIVQMSVDSNQVYVRSNIAFLGTPAVVRSVWSPTLDNDWLRSGHLEVRSNQVRFEERTTQPGASREVFVANQFGIFSLARCALYGSNETLTFQSQSDPLGPPQSFTQFARVESTLSNGLVYGLGISNDPIAPASYDVFAARRDGSLWLRNSSSAPPQLEQCFDSNARLSKGPLTIDGTGVLAHGGRPLITDVGAIMRRTNAESPEGFLVSPSGFVTIGGLNIQTTGAILSSSNATFGSNVTASNLIGTVQVTASNLVASNAFFRGATFCNATFCNASLCNATASNLVATQATVSNAAACNLHAVTMAACNLSVPRVTLTQGGDHIVTGTGTTRSGVGTYLGGMVRVMAPRTDVGSVRLSAPTNADASSAGATFADYLTVITGPTTTADLGNVGIGTTVPLARLDVNGEIRESGGLLRERYAPSNILVASSNALFAGVTWTSNLAVATSNSHVALSNSHANTSNTAAWGSNTAGFASNSSIAGSAVAAWSSNTAMWTSNVLPAYRRTDASVPWASISGKPDFDEGAGSLSVGGVVLGTAGLVFGGAALLNQNGQLTGILANAANSLRLDPGQGYGRLRNLDLSDSETAPLNIQLRSDGWASFNAGARFGAQSIWLSNDALTITTPGISNVRIGTGSSWLLSNLAIGSSNVTTAPLSLSSFVAQGDAVINADLAGSSFLTGSHPTTPIWLARVNNRDLASNQLWGGVCMRWYNGVGSAPYGFVERQTIGMGFVVRNGASSNVEALTLRNDGNVGIGSSNPADRLVVVGNASVSGTISEQGSNLATRYAASNQLSALSANFTGWSNALSNQVTTRQLVVSSNSDFGGNIALFDNQIRLRSATDGNHLLRYDAVSDGPLLQGNVGGALALASGARVLRWNNNGVQMRQSDSVFFKDTNHGIRYDTAQDGASVFGWNGGRLNSIGGGGGTALVWNNSGRVGIGLTNPSDRLHVNGNTIVSGTISEQGSNLAARYAASNTLAAVSNVAAFGSNTAVWASNNNSAAAAATATATSNLAYPLAVGFSNNRVWRPGFEGCFTLCNVVVDTFGPNHLTLRNSDTSTPAQMRFDKTSVTSTCDARIGMTETGRNFFIECQGSDRVNINAVGNVGIGTSNPQARLHCIGPARLQTAWVGDAGDGRASFAHASNASSSNNYALSQTSDARTRINCGTGQSILLEENGVPRAGMLSGGGVFCQNRVLLHSGNLTATSFGWMMSTTSLSNLALVSADDQSYFQGTVPAACNVLLLNRAGNVTVPRGDVIIQNRNSSFAIRPGLKVGASNASWTEMDPEGGLFVWDALEVNGPITGTSKSFRIPHPVREGRDLVHRCVEGIDSDLIYRGKVKLNKGEACVDMDAATGMCPGTFAALAADPDVFLQADKHISVIGVVQGGALMIQASNKASTATVSWMVMARRSDLAPLTVEPEASSRVRRSASQD